MEEKCMEKSLIHFVSKFTALCSHFYPGRFKAAFDSIPDWLNIRPCSAV